MRHKMLRRNGGHTCAELCVGAASAILQTALRGGQKYAERVSPKCDWRPLLPPVLSVSRAAGPAPSVRVLDKARATNTRFFVGFVL